MNLVNLTTERNMWRAYVNMAMNSGIARGPGISSIASGSSCVEQLSSIKFKDFFKLLIPLYPREIS